MNTLYKTRMKSKDQFTALHSHLISLLFKLLIVSTFYLEGYYIKCIMSFIYTVFKNKLLN